MRMQGPPGPKGASAEKIVQGPAGPPGPPGAGGGQVEKFYHAASAHAPVQGGCHWAYSGADGPDSWGSICAGTFSNCAAGTSQSPIDVATGSLVTAAAAPTLGWSIPDTTAAQYVNYAKGSGGDTAYESFDGHTFNVEHIKATFAYENVAYTLTHFEMHTRSEHTVDGEHSDLEIQFVHTTEDPAAANAKLIVAAFFKIEPGQGSPTFIRQLAAAVPKLTGTPAGVVHIDFAEVAQTVMIGSLAHRGATAASFTPNFKNYMAYQGSVTAPPCTEGVQWLLLRNPVYIYGEDYAALHSLLGDNFRPVQPLDGRVVSSSV